MIRLCPTYNLNGFILLVPGDCNHDFVSEVVLTVLQPQRRFAMTTLLCCSCSPICLPAKSQIWKPQSLSYKTYLAHVLNPTLGGGSLCT